MQVEVRDGVIVLSGVSSEDKAVLRALSEHGATLKLHTAQHRCDGSYAIEQEIVLPTKVMRSIDMGKAVDQHEHKRNAESVVPVMPRNPSP